MSIVLLIFGLYWIIFSFFYRAKDIKSAVFCVVIPFFTGLNTFVYALYLIRCLEIYNL